MNDIVVILSFSLHYLSQARINYSSFSPIVSIDIQFFCKNKDTNDTFFIIYISLKYPSRKAWGERNI